MLCHNISSGINNYNADGILANFLLQKGSDRLAKKSIRLKRIYIYIFLNNLTKKSAKVIKIPPNQSEALIQILRLLKISIFKTATSESPLTFSYKHLSRNITSGFATREHRFNIDFWICPSLSGKLRKLDLEFTAR